MTKDRKKRNNFRILLASFLIFFILQSIHANDFDEVKEDVVKKAWKRIGFIYIAPSVLFKNVGYNTNIFYFDEELTPDWTADLGFHVNFSSIIGKRFILELRESPYYSFFLKNKDLEYFNNEMMLSLYTWLGPFNLKYSYSKKDYLSRPTQEFGSRIRTNRISSTFSLEYGNYRNFFIRIIGKSEDVEFEGNKYYKKFDIASLLSNKKNSIQCSFNKIVFTKTLLFFNINLYDLEFGSDTYRGGTGGVFSTGIEFPQKSVLSGGFQVGIKYFYPDDPNAKNWLKFNGSGDISMKLTRRIKIGLMYSVDNDYSYYEPDLYFDFRGYTILLNYYIYRNIKLGYSYFNGLIRYRNIRGDKIGRDDTIAQTSINIGVRILNEMEFGIRYTRYVGISSLVEYRRSYFFIGGYISHEF